MDRSGNLARKSILKSMSNPLGSSWIFLTGTVGYQSQNIEHALSMHKMGFRTSNLT